MNCMVIVSGVGVPPTEGRDGAPLPTPRKVSEAIHQDNLENSTDLTALFPVWGQMVIHDIITTTSGPGNQSLLENSNGVRVFSVYKKLFFNNFPVGALHGTTTRITVFSVYIINSNFI